jgi:hypothetical protein
MELATVQKFCAPLAPYGVVALHVIRPALGSLDIPRG